MRVLVVDDSERLREALATGLRTQGMVVETAADGQIALERMKLAPYDVIVVTGSLPVVPEALRNQLRVGGRMAVIVGTDPVMTAQLITRASETDFDVVKLFETSVKPLKNAERPSSFRF